MDANVVWKHDDKHFDFFRGKHPSGAHSTELLEIIIPWRQLIATCGPLSIKSFSLDGKEIWSRSVAELVVDRHGRSRYSPSISHFVIRNGHYLWILCWYEKCRETRQYTERNYTFGISVQDGTPAQIVSVPAHAVLCASPEVAHFKEFQKRTIKKSKFKLFCGSWNQTIETNTSQNPIFVQNARNLIK